MKYNINDKPLQCFMTNSTCYNYTSPMIIKGVLLHSTGADNPALKRYVQPTNPNDDIIEILGINQYGNDWNHIYVEAGVNAWIGLDATNAVRSIQTLPWDYQPWGCGVGPKGSCNNGWIQIEICEDSLCNAKYFEAVYREACELTAYLCSVYNINPKGTVVENGVIIPTILCHADSYKLQMGSNHIDLLHWFERYNKTMDDFRQEVENLLKPQEEDDEEMTQDKFNEFMNGYLTQLAEKPAAQWSAAERAWATGSGLIKGDENGKLMYKKFITREECIVMLFRLYNLLKKGR